jgi:hypothetical protein
MKNCAKFASKRDYARKIITVSFTKEAKISFLPIFRALFLVGFIYLHLLVFSFIYQFHSRIEALVSSSFEND